MVLPVAGLGFGWLGAGVRSAVGGSWLARWGLVLRLAGVFAVIYIAVGLGAACALRALCSLVCPSSRRRTRRHTGLLQ